MEDKKQVDGVRLLSWHQHVELEFYDESVRVAINSTDADYIRRKIREKIDRASVTLCLVGVDTWRSDWVDWELRYSLSVGKRVIAMGLPGGPKSLRLPEAIGQWQSFPLWNVCKLQQLINETPDVPLHNAALGSGAIGGLGRLGRW